MPRSLQAGRLDTEQLHGQLVKSCATVMSLPDPRVNVKVIELLPLALPDLKTTKCEMRGALSWGKLLGFSGMHLQEGSCLTVQCCKPHPLEASNPVWRGQGKRQVLSQAPPLLLLCSY